MKLQYLQSAKTELALDSQANFDKYILLKSSIYSRLTNIRATKSYEKQLTENPAQQIDVLVNRIATIGRDIKFNKPSLFREQTIKRLSLLTEIEADLKKNYLHAGDTKKYIEMLDRLNPEGISNR